MQPFPRRREILSRSETAGTSARRQFRRLQWELVRDFTGVMALVTLLLALGCILLFSLLIYAGPALPLLLASESEERVAPYLGQIMSREDAQHELPKAVGQIAAGLRSQSQRYPNGFSFSIETAQDPERAVFVGVIDRQGTWIVTEGAGPTNGRRVKALLSVPELRIVERALRGESDPGQLGYPCSAWAGRGTNGEVIAVASIRQASQIRGVLVIRLKLPFRPWAAMQGAAEILGPVAGVTVLLTLIGGTIAGFLTSRRITRRLEDIAATAEFWGKGQLDSRAAERPDDELGVLATRLNAMAADLSALMELRPELAKLEERQRLTRDLHDTVKQEVFALAMQISALKTLLLRAEVAPEQTLIACREKVTQLNALIQRIQEELGNVLQELRPLTAEPLAAHERPAFEETMTQLGENWSRQSGIALTRTTDGTRIALPTEQQLNLLRLIREALSNVARHSGADHVELRVSRQHGRLVLCVADNGTGFPADDRRGLGLRTMQERAAKLPTGRLEIISAPGQGTQVIVSFSDSASQKEETAGYE